jgi:hypothetical protein
MATRCGAPHWIAHQTALRSYDLSHLHPFFFHVTLPAIDPKPGRAGFAQLDIRVAVTFSHHCFSRSLADVPGYTVDDIYEDTGRREERCFCEMRWGLSQKLPALIRGLQRCFHTGKHNFFTVEIGGAVAGDYAVYFDVKRGGVADVNLSVESAYARTDKPHLSKAVGKIGFAAILRTAIRGIHPHPPPRS